MTMPARATCSNTEPVAGAAMGSPVSSRSRCSSCSRRTLMESVNSGQWTVDSEAVLLASLGVDRLGDDGDVRDPRLFDGVHDAGESPEGYTLVGAQVDHLLRGVATGGVVQLLRQIVNVDGRVAEEDLLVAI